MLDSIGAFSRVLFFLGLIWFAIIVAMIYLAAYLSARRALKEDPKQFRGWNRKDR